MGFLFGLFVGAVIFKVASRRGRWRRHRHHHWGHGHYQDGWSSADDEGPRWRRGHSFEDRALFKMSEKLQLSPEQEHKVGELLREVFAEVRQGRRTLKGLRRSLADVFAADAYDTEKMGEWIHTQNEAYEGVRDKMVDAVGRVYEILDPTQRARVTRMLGRPGFAW